MAIFTINAIDPKTNRSSTMYYDNLQSTLTDDKGLSVISVMSESLMAQRSVAPATSKDTPLGKTTPRVLKISLGLSCNYECEYCSQRFVPRANETNPDDISNFVDGLDSWVLEAPEKVEFWGGEPLVYIKTLRPLAERIRAKYPDAAFTLITNGSLLNIELNKWLVDMGFNVGLSHDGPGQHVRGPDPLADPDTKAAILDLYGRLAPLGRMSFNSMMNRSNTSRAAVQDFFIKLTGDANVRIGEGSIVDAYDEGGLANSLLPEDYATYRNRAFAELRSGKASNFGTITMKVSSFINSLRTRRPATTIGQRCGMDKPDTIAVDLKGNVLTCQNVSSVGMAPNGQSHKIGHVSNLADVKLDTATHWSFRKECSNCPVLHICQGSCMFLENELWSATCNNAYSDSIPVFAAGIEFLTGLVPMKITGPHREDRHDIWKAPAATAPALKKKIIPIAVTA